MLLTMADEAPVSAHDVARELEARLPHLGEVKLHKLLYYCQGRHLGWTGQPLFRETVEAWANGPVVADLWRARKHGQDLPPSQPLSPGMLATVGYVVSRYGSATGTDLIRLTHNEDPWRRATEHSGPDERCEEEITRESLINYFAKVDVDPLTTLTDQIFSNPGLRKSLEDGARAMSSRQAVRDDMDQLRVPRELVRAV